MPKNKITIETPQGDNYIFEVDEILSNQIIDLCVAERDKCQVTIEVCKLCQWSDSDKVICQKCKQSIAHSYIHFKPKN